MFDINLHYRCFLSIYPPKEVRSQLRDINRLFKKYERNFRFIPLDQIHLTLQFMGKTVSGESLQFLHQNLVEIISEYPRINITLDELKYGFPSQNIATHLYYSIKENNELEEMVKDLHKNIKEFDLRDINKKKDHSKLINHLTIARIKNTSSRSFSKTINDFVSEFDFQPITFEVKELKILASKFKNNITEYSELLSFQLNDNNGEEITTA